MHQLSVIEAELWGIYYGLKLAWERGFHKIKVYSDSLVAIKLLKYGCPLTHPHCTLVENVHQIHLNERSVDWIHVFREANQVVDRLAKHGLS
ncbi:ribonuclease H protein, partial [Trifolium medium]|nr:ribonuclease H protein [Trifolium medium]